MEEAQRPDELNREVPPNIQESRYEAIAEFCQEYLNHDDPSDSFWLEFENNLHSLLDKIWNEDIAKRVHSAEKELKELQGFQKKQHEELVKCQQQLEEDNIKAERHKMWAESAEALLNKANKAFASLQQSTEQLSREQSGYLEKRNKLVDFNQKMTSCLETAMHKMDEQKKEKNNELQKLRQRLKQEQGLTDAMIQENERDLHDGFKELMKELEQADIECLGVEADLEVAIQKQQKMNERLKSVNKQIKEEEEKSYIYEETDHIISEMKTETHQNEAFINAELIKEQNLKYQLKQNSEECDVQASNYTHLQKENSELQQKWEREFVKRQKFQKALEQSIKELLVLKSQNKAERDKMCKKNADMEQQVQDNMMKTDFMLKCLSEKDTSINLLEEENTKLQQRRNSLIDQLAQAKNNLVQNENSFQSLSLTLESLRKEVEDGDNLIGQEMLLRKEQLEMVVVKTEQMAYILHDIDNNEKQLELEQHILCEEWETVNQQVKHPNHKIFESENGNSDELEIDNSKLSELKTQQELTLKQTEVLNEKCWKAEETKNDLMKQIELQESAFEKNVTDTQCLQQEIENLESTIQHVHVEMSHTQEKIQKKKENLLGKEHLSESIIEQLDSEIEDLENKLKAYQTAGSEDNQEDTLDYENHVQHFSERLSLENDKRKSLEETCHEIARNLEEVVCSREEKLKNTEKEIDTLEKGLKEQKEFIEATNNKMSQWMKPIASNEKRCAKSNDQLEEEKKRVSALKDEMAALIKELESFQKETAATETDSAAEYETLTNELEQIKKSAAETKRLKEAERTALVNDFKKAQSYYRELVVVASSSLEKVETKESTRNTAGGGGPITQAENPDKFTTPRRETPYTYTQPNAAECSSGSSSSSSIVLTREDRQQILQEPKKTSLIMARLRQEKRQKRKPHSQ